MKMNAQSYAHVYLKRGKIVKTGCAVCGCPDVQMHHEDYLKPTEIIWLCLDHHLERHGGKWDVIDSGVVPELTVNIASPSSVETSS